MRRWKLLLSLSGVLILLAATAASPATRCSSQTVTGSTGVTMIPDSRAGSSTGTMKQGRSGLCSHPPSNATRRRD